MRAKRSLGQNFLVDPNLQRKIVDSLSPTPEDTVVEIGPGRGALTDHLAGRVRRLIAIELDDDLAAALADRYRHREDVSIVHADALAWEPRSVLDSPPVKVAGNIPYNITSPILFRLLDWDPAPERIVLMVQKEVADRLVAHAGQKEYGALTVGVRAVADVERLYTVGRQAFRPVPNVDSAVVALRPVPHRVTGTDRDSLRSLTRAAFGMRRKQMQKILRSAPAYGLTADQAEAVLERVGIRPEDRPEDVQPPTFVQLAAALDRLGYPRREEALR